ncbi:MAG: DUF885 domain-containing protein [Lachnospiraceae bacterium]|nr:DUF885 domain-containing protein [Lachnospiraceae bacterium]
MTRLNRLFRRSSVFLLIVSMIVFSLAGCQGSKSGKTYESFSPENEKTQASGTSNESSSGQSTVSDRFEEFTRALFCDEITENTLNLHYALEDPASYGISDYPLTLGEYGQQVSQEAGERAEDLLVQLKEYDYDELTADQRFTYDLLENTLKLSSESNDFPYYAEVLQPSIGMQSELPTLLAEYTFNTEKDVTDYLALLKDIKRYFQEIISYEQEKSKAGLFMSDYCADMVIKDCESFISQTDDNFLITTFEERLDEMQGLDEDRKEAWIIENRQLVTGDVIDAWQMLIDALKELKGTGSNDGGICNFEMGKEYYEYMLKLSVGTDRPVKELENMTIDQMNADIQAIQELVDNNPMLYSASEDFEFSLTDPKEIIEDLQVKMKDDFPELETDINLQIKYVSKSMEDSLSPAFYLTPPIDNPVDNVIYINGGSSDPSDLYSTLAHEGYPGHLYQTVYTSSCSTSPIRYLCSTSGYSEGWATYVENLSYSYDTDIDADLASLMQHNNSANLGIYALLDFYINYEGQTLDEITDFLNNFYNIDNEDDVRDIYYYIVSQPCNYLNYYIGYLEILDLKADAQEALGESFNLKDFHTFFLEMGDAPFYIIREYMESWIESVQAGA